MKTKKFKHVWKRVVSMLMAVVLLVSMVPLPESAAKEATSTDAEPEGRLSVSADVLSDMDVSGVWYKVFYDAACKKEAAELALSTDGNAYAEAESRTEQTLITTTYESALKMLSFLMLFVSGSSGKVYYMYGGYRLFNMYDASGNFVKKAYCGWQYSWAPIPEHNITPTNKLKVTEGIETDAGIRKIRLYKISLYQLNQFSCRF